MTIQNDDRGGLSRICTALFFNLNKYTMTILITLQLVFLILNILCAAWNYNTRNYKMAIFSGFCAGFLFDSLLNTIP